MIAETLKEGRNLAGRLQGSDVFRRYVTKRKQLVIPAVVLFLLISVACTAASIMFVAGAHSSFLVLLALIASPVILLGSLFVQLQVFFSWLEGRALARALPHAAKPARGALSAWVKSRLKADLGAAPSVPWLFAAVFLLAPLAALARIAPVFALALIAAGILLPLVYSRFDR
jgi:hypothetical protein